jgi:alpha-galactosidase
LCDYYTAWYRMLDEIRAAYPGTFFEGCASGAMRADLATLGHFDSHFLSDSVNSVDMLRISQGAWLRLPPGRLTRWAVLRSAAQAVPRYGKTVADSPPTLMTPAGALWEPAGSVDLDFALLAAMPGMLGFSGDLASLAPEDRARTAQAISFYKKWRRHITGAVAHLLTPPEPMGQREGWVAVQLQTPDADTGLVFVYRLGSAGAPPSVRPRGLVAAAHYTVARGFGAMASSTESTGAELMRDGLALDGPEAFVCRGGHAEVFSLTQG